jgi:hypothetical protein
MAENNWLLNDSAPVSFAQEFQVAPSEGVWGWFGLPMAGEGTEFAAATSPWSETYWTPAEMAFNGPETPPASGDVPNTALLSRITLGQIAITASGLGGTLQ